MRLLLGLVLTFVLVAGCSQEKTDDPAASPSTASIGPEDTLPVLGAWQSEEYVDRHERLVLTLSDDNTYMISDSCIEMPGRWQLSQGQVELTPKPEENARCSELHEWPTLPEVYDVEGDRLVSPGEESIFTRL